MLSLSEKSVRREEPPLQFGIPTRLLLSSVTAGSRRRPLYEGAGSGRDA